jgi:hypothetical protein
VVRGYPSRSTHRRISVQGQLLRGVKGRRVVQVLGREGVVRSRDILISPSMIAWGWGLLVPASSFRQRACRKRPPATVPTPLLASWSLLVPIPPPDANRLRPRLRPRPQPEPGADLVRERVVREEECVRDAPLVILEGGGNGILQAKLRVVPQGAEVHGGLQGREIHRVDGGGRFDKYMAATISARGVAACHNWQTLGFGPW